MSGTGKNPSLVSSDSSAGRRYRKLCRTLDGGGTQAREESGLSDSCQPAGKKKAGQGGEERLQEVRAVAFQGEEAAGGEAGRLREG